MRHFFIAIASILLIIYPWSTSAYDNNYVHKAINKNAAVQSFLGNILIEQLAYEKGIETKFNGKEAWEWLEYGGKMEDEPGYRTSNHFHDPLNPWPQAGFKGSWLGTSSLLWAQDQKAEELDGRDNWSWLKARDLFYSSLTSRYRADRDERLAFTFRGLGHVIHLLSDATVPAHVRNDAHILGALFSPKYVGWNYESWAQANWNGYIKANNLYFGKKVNSSIFDSYVAAPSASVPIAVLWDKNVYNADGSNPEVTWTTNPVISEYGLSEYTNANFFSEDTIFRDYPHPKKENTTAKLVEQYAIDGKLDNVWYVMGYQTERLAALSYFSEVDIEKGWKYHLDSFVYQDYAKNLIPRAVGYSTALLNYFFRGDIRLEYTTSPNPGYVIVNKTDEDMSGLFQILYDNNKDQRVKYMDGNFSLGKQSRGDVFDITAPADAKEPGKYILAFKGNMGNEKGAVAGYVPSRLLEITPPDQFIYSMISDIGNDPYFRSIKAKVKNASPSEQMKNGTIQAVAKYKSDTYDAGFMYSISDPQAIDLSSDAAVEIAFNFNNDPIPVDVTDLYLEVIFKGTIGNDANATASGVKDIREPTPIDVFNDTDKSCISGSWYSTADAVDLMDTNSPKDHIADTWDVNPHILQDIYAKISSMAKPQKASPSVYNAVVPSLKPGEFQRVIYILTDEYYTYSFYSTWIPSPGNFDRWSHANKEHTFNGTAVKNQTDYSSDPAVCGRDPWCYIYHNPGYYSLRGNDMWWGGGVVYINQPYPADSSCKGY